MKLTFKGLYRTGIENVDNAGIDDLVKHERIVTAVVEYFSDFWICKSISEYLFWQFKGFCIFILHEGVKVKYKGIGTIA